MTIGNLSDSADTMLQFPMIQAPIHGNDTLSSCCFATVLKVTASAECGNDTDCIYGQRIAAGDHGVVVFDGIVFNGLNGTYNLTLMPETFENAVEAPFSIRQCRPGEERVNASVVDTQQGGMMVTAFVCNNCTPNMFSFLPTVQCRDCDPNAICNGGAVAVPRDGYWHSTPFSVQYHECLVADACTYETEERSKGGEILNQRSDVLADFFVGLDLKDVQGEMHPNDKYRQCREVGAFSFFNSITRGAFKQLQAM